MGLGDILVPRGGSRTADEDLQDEPASAAGTGPFACVFAENAIEGQLAPVVVPGWDDGVHRTEARWEPHPEDGGTLDLPLSGDDGLLFMDDNGDAWCVAWWRS